MGTLKTVLCFGDSNTYGSMPMADLNDIRRHDENTRWPGVLRQRLGETWRVIEEGQPGRTTTQDDPIEGAHKNGLRVLPALLESHAPIDLVIVKLGTNDLKVRFSVTAGDISLSIRKLLMTIAATTAGPGFTAPKVLVISPPPILEAGCLADMFTGGAAKSAGLADAYRGIAEGQGAAYLDAGAVMSVDPLDGIHYDATAHQNLGAEVASKVLSLF